MYKIVVSVLVFFMLAKGTFASSMIVGDSSLPYSIMNESQVWDVDTVHLYNLVLFKDSNELTITPGTTVIMHSDSARLEVFGPGFTAVGTKEDSIIFTTTDSNYMGGGLQASQKIRIEYCKFEYQESNSKDGILFASSNPLDSMIIRHSLFQNNLGRNAVSFSGKAYHLIESNTFRNNTRAIKVANAPNTWIQNNTFIENSSTQSGGAILIEGNGDPSGYFINNWFIRNKSEKTGGAVLIEDQGTAHFYGNYFDGNMSNGSGGAAAAINGGEFIFINNTFANNRGGNSGGAYYADIGYAAIINCLFYNNSARADGEELYDRVGGTPPTKYSKFYLREDGDPTADSMRLHFAATDAYESYIDRGVLNFDTVSYPTYHNGLPPIYMPYYDINGNPRVAGKSIDLGAIELVNDTLLPDTSWYSQIPINLNDTTSLVDSNVTSVVSYLSKQVFTEIHITNYSSHITFDLEPGSGIRGSANGALYTLFGKKITGLKKISQSKWSLQSQSVSHGVYLVVIESTAGVILARQMVSIK
ncbi:MAG: right-handed parallel beta-helix repeat-containing protein [Fibrobacterales bacterium]